MSENNEKNKYDYYFPIFTGLGLMLGLVFKQIPIGLCLGVAVGLALDSKKKK